MFQVELSWLHRQILHTGFVEKKPPAAFPAFAGAASRLRAGALRRASAQAGRHISVLTYYADAPRVKMAAALLDGPFGKTHGMVFLTDPQPLIGHLILDKFARGHPHYSTLPYLLPGPSIVSHAAELMI